MIFIAYLALLISIVSLILTLVLNNKVFKSQIETLDIAMSILRYLDNKEKKQEGL